MAHLQRIKLDHPGSQLALEVENLSIPAIAVPVAWLLQLYATLDGQPNSLTADTFKTDLQSIFAQHAGLTLNDIQNVNVQDVYNYTVTTKDSQGHLSSESLTAADDEHAREEASCEFDDPIVSIERGERLPNLKPWHLWPK